MIRIPAIEMRNNSANNELTQKEGLFSIEADMQEEKKVNAKLKLDFNIPKELISSTQNIKKIIKIQSKDIPKEYIFLGVFMFILTIALFFFIRKPKEKPKYKRIISLDQFHP